MDVLIRLLIRFLLVPIGTIAAVIAATLVAAVANWAEFMSLIAPDPMVPPAFDVAMMLSAVVLVAAQSIAIVLMLLPGVVGIVLSEALAIRSWMFHVLLGGLSIWIGWTAMEEYRNQYALFGDAKIVVAAGLAAGFAYWAVAGWNAGFWKPVFRGRTLSVPPDDPNAPGGRNLL